MKEQDITKDRWPVTQPRLHNRPDAIAMIYGHLGTKSGPLVAAEPLSYIPDAPQYLYFGNCVGTTGNMSPNFSKRQHA